MRFSKLIGYLAAVVLLLTSCEEGEVRLGYSPPGIPIEVSISSAGAITVSVSHSINTPIGTFTLGGGTTIFSIGQKNDNKLLIVRVDDRATVYELEEGKEFSVAFKGGNRLYTQVALEYDYNGDIVLELESAEYTRTREREMRDLKIELIAREEQRLRQLANSSTAPQKAVRAQILLAAHDHPEWSNVRIAKELGCPVWTVRRWRRSWAERRSIEDRPQ